MEENVQRWPRPVTVKTAKGQDYAIGLAVNPSRQGELLVTAGDWPPGIGVHIQHSIDGGASFQDITDQVYGAIAAIQHSCSPSSVIHLYLIVVVSGATRSTLLFDVDNT